MERPSLEGRAAQSRLSLRWCVDIQWEMSARHAEVCASTWLSEREEDRISCVSSA